MLGTFRLWESIPDTTARQTFTISRTGKKWFVSFGIEAALLPVHPLLNERYQETFGIDVGVISVISYSAART